MGFLDFPAPLLSWVDRQAAVAIPEFVRVVLWAVVAAVLSTFIYWLLSPQHRLSHLAAEERALKHRLKDDPESLSEGLISTGHLLGLALRRIGLVLPPTIVAALPVLSIMVWLHTHFAYDMPQPHQTVAVRVVPPSARAQVVAGDDRSLRIELHDDDGGLRQSVTLDAAVPVMHKYLWWNALIGNPLGYLPDDSPIERIEIDLPEKHYLAIGPDWLRTWLTPFLATLLAGSILLKFLLRIR